MRSAIEEYPAKDKMQDLKLIEWLSNLLIFASDDRCNIAAWDLKSFNGRENSYDIYWIHIEPFEDEIYKIGSNFFDFIHNFCLARKKYIFLPEYMQPEACDRFFSCRTVFDDI